MLEGIDSSSEIFCFLCKVRLINEGKHCRKINILTSSSILAFIISFRGPSSARLKLEKEAQEDIDIQGDFESTHSQQVFRGKEAPKYVAPGKATALRVYIQV